LHRASGRSASYGACAGLQLEAERGRTLQGIPEPTGALVELSRGERAAHSRGQCSTDGRADLTWAARWAGATHYRMYLPPPLPPRDAQSSLPLAPPPPLVVSALCSCSETVKHRALPGSSLGSTRGGAFSTRAYRQRQPLLPSLRRWLAGRWFTPVLQSPL
jgi:hypothetical protein